VPVLNGKEQHVLIQLETAYYSNSSPVSSYKNEYTKKIYKFCVSLVCFVCLAP